MNDGAPQHWAEKDIGANVNHTWYWSCEPIKCETDTYWSNLNSDAVEDDCEDTRTSDTCIPYAGFQRCCE